jgi:hypothetical protein
VRAGGLYSSMRPLGPLALGLPIRILIPLQCIFCSKRVLAAPAALVSLPLALLKLLLVLHKFFGRHGLNVSPLSRALFWPPTNGLLQTGKIFTEVGQLDRGYLLRTSCSS